MVDFNDELLWDSSSLSSSLCGKLTIGDDHVSTSQSTMAKLRNVRTKRVSHN